MRAIEMSEIKTAARDGRVWCEIGVVAVLDNESSHYELLKNDSGSTIDVLVGVKFGHSGEQVLCRLGMTAGRQGGFGLWTIPPVGTEVLVHIPQGEYEADAVIVAMASSGGVPSQLDDTTIVLSNAKNIVIDSTESDVNITANGKVNLQGGDQPIARKTDPVNMGTFFIKGGVSNSFAGISWVPPDGTLADAQDIPVLAPTTLSPLTGKVKDGSGKANCG